MMVDLQTSIQQMNERLAPTLSGLDNIQKMVERSCAPGLMAFVRDHKTLMDRIYPPGMMAVFRGQQDMIEKMHSPVMMQRLKMNDILVKAAMPIGMIATHPFCVARGDWFSKLGAISGSMQRTFDRLNRIDLSKYDFTLDDDEEIEAVEYEFVPKPELEIPEKRIILLDEVSRVRNAITAIYRDNNHLYRLQPREFEEVMAELLRSRGFEVHLTKQTRDGGRDIIALQDMSGLGMRMLVECKRYALRRKVGVDMIRSFGHVVSTEHVNKGLLCTTSYFTADAQREQQRTMPYLLELKDRNEILNWVNSYAGSSCF